MTIWLLALLLLASLAGLGYRQGAIRVAFSFLGIVLGALLAAPLGALLARLLGTLGLKQPVLAWALGPLLVFVLILAAFKVAGAAVHQKVDVYYKYHAGDLRLALWERLHHRLGLCLAMLNGAAYLILLSFVIYIFSYWTVQLASSDNDPRSMRLLNRMGRDLQTTGFAKVARSVETLPPSYFQAADVAGLLFQNSLLEARLLRYPAFLGLAERSEFQNLANDKGFLELRQNKSSLKALLDYQSVQPIVKSPELLRTIWTTAVPDLKDLRTFLETGRSPKYDPQPILGRWQFDAAVTVNFMRRSRPRISALEMRKWKNWMLSAFAKTCMVAMTDHQVLLKDMPSLKPAATSGPQTLQGQWKDLDGKYQLSFPDSKMPATIEGDRLTLKAQEMELVFNRED